DGAVACWYLRASSAVRCALVGFSRPCAVAVPRACDSSLPARWTVPARGIPRFLRGGRFLRVGFHDSRAMDYSRAWDSTIPERWTVPAREISRFLSDRTLPRVRFLDS